MRRTVLTDIEGTTSAIDFVHKVLFPYARAHLPGFVRAQSGDTTVRALIDEVRGHTGGDDEAAIATLIHWIDIDRKATPLKALQGLIWREGYRKGHFTGHVYVDAFDQLRAWRKADVPMYVYSSGSIEAQKLLFGHSVFGDLQPCFRGYFDTTSGGKREAASYRRIADAIGAPPASILFLSDVEAELDAAAESGLATVQLVRPDTLPESNGRHATAANFRDITP